MSASALRSGIKSCLSTTASNKVCKYLNGLILIKILILI